MLATIGERAQVSLETRHPSVVQAVAVLESNDYDFQGRGWWFNKEVNVRLMPDANSGEIRIPAESMEFRLSPNCAHARDGGRYVPRGTRLYDTVNHTYNIGAAVSADMTLRVPIENLPPQAFTYLKHLAAQAMYEDEDGDNQKLQRLSERKAFAWQQLQAAQFKAAAPNALHSPAAQALTYRIRQSGVPSNPMFPGGRW